MKVELTARHSEILKMKRANDGMTTGKVNPKPQLKGAKEERVFRFLRNWRMSSLKAIKVHVNIPTKLIVDWGDERSRRAQGRLFDPTTGVWVPHQCRAGGYY
jgi:hypothetical protein